MYYIGLINDDKSEVRAKGYRRIMYANTPAIQFGPAISDWGSIEAMGIADSEHGEFLKIVDFNFKKLVCANDSFAITQDSIASSFNEYIKIERMPTLQSSPSMFPSSDWPWGGEIHGSGVYSDFGRRFVWDSLSGKVRDNTKQSTKTCWNTIKRLLSNILS